MNTKKILLLLTICISTAQVSSNDTIAQKAFKNREWEYMDYTFIIKPNKELYSLKSKLKLAAATFGGFISSVFGTLIYVIETNQLNRLENDKKFEKAIDMPCLIATCGTLLGYLWYLPKSIMFNALKNFIKQWPANKNITPNELHDLFDELYQLYKTDYKKFKKVASDSLYIIRQAIELHFPKRYQTITTNGTTRSIGMMSWVFGYENQSNFI
ncbi:MAG: hypothetical protein WDZ41_04325 [Candidatus Babeliales bacterium]